MTTALDLFSEHGVNGTSLGMIAEAIGVSKAAIYYQFNTKDEIVLAVAEMELAKLESTVDSAETESDRLKARDQLVGNIIDLAVENRPSVSVLQHDPVMVRLLAQHEAFQPLFHRVETVLLDQSLGDEARIAVAWLSATIGAAVSHPLIGSLDNDELRARLLNLAPKLLDNSA